MGPGLAYVAPAMADTKRIFIVDDHPLFREGLKALIDRQKGFHVVGESGDGYRAVEQAVAAEPDVVVMDISLPGQSGLRAAATIRTALPLVRVLFLSGYSSEDVLLDAYEAGGLGFLSKESAPQNIITALTAVSAGQLFLDDTMSREVLAGLLKSRRGKGVLLDQGGEPLTQREDQVLRLAAEGRGNAEIASMLDISVKTVENHRSNLMAKLGLENAAQLVIYAIRAGILDPESFTKP